MRMMPRATLSAKRRWGAWCRCQVSGVAQLVGVQRAVQNNGNVKSEPKYLACEESLAHAFDCWFFCFLLALLASSYSGLTTSWLYFLSESLAIGYVQQISQWYSI